ncbi:MAG: TolC family protein [Planctomycetales bacterium]|nr:TolC family protein [Planctomycetales bacterium]
MTKRQWKKLVAAFLISGSGSVGCVSMKNGTHIERSTEAAKPWPVSSSQPTADKARNPLQHSPEVQLAAHSTAPTDTKKLDYMTVPSSAYGPIAAELASPIELDIPQQHFAVGFENGPVYQQEFSRVAMDTMTLADLESLALGSNPTLRELAATTRKAAGYREQVGLRPNPIVGYQGVQIADQGTDQHTAFIQQDWVRGDKLQRNRQVLNEAVRAQLLELDAQRHRVITDLRVKFYEALAAQSRIQLIREFQEVTNEGLKLAELRQQALEGSRVDVLQAKIQKNEIDLASQQAQIAYDAAWRSMAAIVGVPQLTSTQLEGSFSEVLSAQNWQGIAAEIQLSSPEYQAAQVRVRKARAELARHNIQAIPNLTFQLATGVDNGTDSGLINVQVGAPLPVNNWNQGNIAAARAEYCRAVAEVDRISSAIQARVAEISKEYDSALAAVSTYNAEILPSARETLQLADVAYKAGETSFVQVLVARRTFFESNLDYLQAKSELAQADAKLKGFALTGALNEVTDHSGDDSLRGLTFSQQ